MTKRFCGRHYETGTLINALHAMGAVAPHSAGPYSEALALGASGGIAFGYFVFEYKGHLPHVALLTRNTFAPFERTLDNLAIRRETRETTSPEKGEENLRRSLDEGHPTLVWADAFRLPYSGLPTTGMWHMKPTLVVDHRDGDFWVVDGSPEPFPLSAADLLRARAVVKKERFRIMVLERPDSARLREQLPSAIETCRKLFHEAPPAGSGQNFGISGIRHLAGVLTQVKGAKSWRHVFSPGPRLAQALAGEVGQPGVWDWIEQWGTDSGADRGVYAQFLREAAVIMERPELDTLAAQFEKSRPLWTRFAEAALPSEVEPLRRLKELKRRHAELRWSDPWGSLEARAEIRIEMAALREELADARIWEPVRDGIQSQMANILLEIAEIEGAGEWPKMDE